LINVAWKTVNVKTSIGSDKFVLQASRNAKKVATVTKADRKSYRLV
jgi:hypothetical protein